MSEPKFTPGPWRLGRKDDGYVYVDAVQHQELASVVWQLSDDQYFGESSPHCEANAHLIAAAPELYEALEWAYSTAVEHDDQEEFDWAIYCERLYQALAKARGQG